jgi:hypothetical protein
MSADTKYAKNLALINKAIACEPVERIPLAYAASAFSALYMGVPLSQYAVKMGLQTDVSLAAMKKLGGFDAQNAPSSGAPFDVVLASLWLSKVQLPGRELPENTVWQVLEKESMTVADYDYIIEKGWPKFQNKMFAKVMNSPWDFKKFIIKTILRTPFTNRRFKKDGVVVLAGAIGTYPFEPLCGGRSMHNFFMDLYRMPDKVEAVMDVMLPHMIKGLIMGGKGSKGLGVWVGGWRSASSLLAPKLWDRFVFPYMKKMVEAVTDAGLIAILHLDQDWTRDLARLKELPAKKCLLNTDGMTDLREAKKLLDGHMAILGDVPSSLFSHGTPQQITDYVRDLINDVGPTGLILCPGCDAPFNTKFENMEAFVAAAREFGNV